MYKDKDGITYLRYNWFSSNAVLTETAIILTNRFNDDSINIRRRDRDLKESFNVVLTSLELNEAYEPDRWIRIVTDHEVYGGKSQRSTAHTRDILVAIKWLIKNGYLIKVDKVKAVRIKNSAKTKYLPFTYQLSELWRKEISHEPMSSPNEVWRNPLASYVQLRIKQKSKGTTSDRSVSLPITSEHRERYGEIIDATNHLLSAADEMWRNTTITIGTKLVCSMAASMTRIFNNGSFEEGGRFYCHLQNIQKSMRSHIRFNDEPTIEMDYSGMHPHILYNINGLNCDGHPYAIDGFDREVVKTAFNTLLNRDSKKHKGSLQSSIAKNTDISMSDSARLLDAIFKKHSKVSDKFNSGYGLKLQNIDSQIALIVMDHFIRVMKRPILMVHDSAIVSVRDVESLFLTMRDAYTSTVITRFTDATRLSENKSSLQVNDETYDFSFYPITDGVKVESLNFSDQLTSAIQRSLAGNDIDWNRAIIND